MILIWLALTLLIILVLILWADMLKSYKSFSINGPLPLPLLGNAHLFIVQSTEILNLLHKLKMKYGDIYQVHLFSAPYLILSHPKYIEPVVSSTEMITKGRSYEFLKVWLGQGLLTASGQRWRTHRKFLTPAFHYNMLQNHFFPVFCKNGRILMEKLGALADGTTFNISPIIALAALDNVTEAVMGGSVNAQNNSNSEYVKSIEVLTKIIALRMQVPIVSGDAIFNLLPYKKAQDKALAVLQTQTNNVIEARKKDLKRMNIDSLSGSDDIGIKNNYAFLDLLLLADVDGKKIDQESVREEVDTFMFEGLDTTTSGIVFSLFCMSKYQEVQDKIYEEQKSIFADNMERDPTYVELSQMKYLERAIKESLRLYPPVPLIERKVTNDTKLEEINLLKGASVTLNIFEMHRNPEVFEDPLTFRPERFETDIKNPFSYLLFSAGPRNCIGQRFAMMEMKITISQIIRRFKLLSANVEPQLCADLVLRSKNGVHVILKPRN